MSVAPISYYILCTWNDTASRLAIRAVEYSVHTLTSEAYWVVRAWDAAAMLHIAGRRQGVTRDVNVLNTHRHRQTFNSAVCSPVLWYLAENTSSWGDGAGSSGYLAAGCPTICSRVRLLKESRHTKIPQPVSGAPTSNDHLLYGLRKSGKTSQVLLPLQDIVYTTPVMDAAPASERSPPHICKLHHIKDTGPARFATQELPSVIPLGWCRQ